MSFTAYNDAIHWPIAPCIPGDWNVLSKKDAEQLLGQMQEASSQTVQAVRAVPLSFYKGHVLVEVLLDRGGKDRHGVLYCVAGEKLAVLNGAAFAIHKLNEDVPLKLKDNKTAEEYLRFFCHHVRGDNGSFMLVDCVDDLPWRKSKLAAKYKKKTAKKFKPLVLEKGPPEESDYFFTACVRYANTLFEGKFRVEVGGIIEMLDDQQLDLGQDGCKLPFASQSFDGPLRLVEGKADEQKGA